MTSKSFNEENEEEKDPTAITPSNYTIASIKEDPESPGAKLIAALSCIQANDEHLGTDMIEIVWCLLKMIPGAELEHVILDRQ